MAITQLLGLPGAGKSYEACNHIALPHFAKGRRLVTNVRGLDQEKFVEAWRERAAKEFPGGRPGEILYVKPQDVRRDDFFPDPEDDGAKSVVKAGDIILLDEVGAIWPNRKAVTDRVLRFLTQHRHFDDVDTGWTIEVLLIMQVGALVPSIITQLCQTTISCRKHLQFGALGARRYVTNTFLGGKVIGKSMATVQRKIDVKARPLYSTTREGMANEVSLDDRHSRKTRRVIIAMILGVFVVPVGTWVLIHQFRSMAGGPAAAHAAASVSGSGSPIGETGRVLASSVLPARPRPAGPMLSTKWRIVGFVRSTSRSVVMLSDIAGNVRVLPAVAFDWRDGQPSSGIIEGEVVTDATGLGVGSPVGAARLGGGS